VSTPLAWSEVRPTLDPCEFNLGNSVGAWRRRIHGRTSSKTASLSLTLCVRSGASEGADRIRQVEAPASSDDVNQRSLKGDRLAWLLSPVHGTIASPSNGTAANTSDNQIPLGPPWTDVLRPSPPNEVLDSAHHPRLERQVVDVLVHGHLDGELRRIPAPAEDVGAGGEAARAACVGPSSEEPCA
jgi:hypothetical protein